QRREPAQHVGDARPGPGRAAEVVQDRDVVLPGIRGRERVPRVGLIAARGLPRLAATTEGDQGPSHPARAAEPGTGREVGAGPEPPPGPPAGRAPGAPRPPPAPRPPARPGLPTRRGSGA